jgi:murein DD-endopeptidase MepM/ murein hydrolase activator NlpD
VCRSGGGTITFLDSGWDGVAASRLSRGRGRGGRPGAGDALLVPKDGKDLPVRELGEEPFVKWDKGQGPGKSEVRVMQKLGRESVVLREGTDYYIGADGRAYFYNNVRTILEAQGAEVSFVPGEKKGESAINVTAVVGVSVLTLKEGVDYYIGRDGKAHYLGGPEPPGGEKPGAGTQQQTVSPGQTDADVPAQTSDVPHFIWPLPADANVTAWNSFDEKGSAHPDHLHRGEDFSTQAGTAVYAIADGTVLTVGFDNSRGNYIYVKHDESGYFSVYQHLKETSVSKSTRVTQGQTIGTVGDTGVGGTHLHIEIIQNPPDHDQPGDKPYYGPEIHPLPYHRNPNKLLPVPSSVEQR